MRRTLVLALALLAACAPSGPPLVIKPAVYNENAVHLTPEDEVKRDSALFKSCASAYVLKYRASHLTATELTEAAIGACGEFKSRLRADLEEEYALVMHAGHVRDPPPNMEQEFVDSTLAEIVQQVRSAALRTLAEAPEK